MIVVKLELVQFDEYNYPVELTYACTHMGHYGSLYYIIMKERSDHNWPKNVWSGFLCHIFLELLIVVTLESESGAFSTVYGKRVSTQPSGNNW